MAENLHAAGLAVSIIEMQNQVMAPMDYEMAQLLHENIELNGVRLLLEDGVKSFRTGGERAGGNPAVWRQEGKRGYGHSFHRRTS